jgi:hypothetical protein
MWKVIKENKDLDLPAHKVMVATVRCEEIAHEKLQALGKDEKWRKIEEASRGGAVPGFGKKVSAVLDRYVSEYDAEAGFFDEGVRVAKRNYLISEALEVIQPAYDSVVASHRMNALEKFKADLEGAGGSEDQEFAAVVRRCAETALVSFDGACADASVAQAASAWDLSKAREKLVRDTNAHAQSLRSQRLQQLKSNWKKRLDGAIAEPVSALLDSAPEDAWSSIRELVESETKKVTTGLAAALAGFEPTREEESAILTDVVKYSRTIVEKKAREETNQALIRMKDRFNNIFSHDEDSLPRVWGEEHNVRKITKSARVAALKMLAVIAALRLNPNGEEDGVEDALLTLVNDSDDDGSTRGGSTTSNPLASSTWPGIAPEDTLLTPAQCRSLWRQFRAETEYTISQALSAQEAKRHGNNWLPPPWAIAAMLVLGFNQLMTVLRNPIYLPIVFVGFLLAKAVWVQLDLQRHFQYGALPGLVSISTRFLPTVMETFNGLVAAGTAKPAEDAASFNSSRRSSQAKLSDDDDD